MRDLYRIGTILLVCCAAAGTALAGAPLHEAAVKGDLEEIDRLIAEGMDVNVLKWKAWTPLAYASKAGRFESVRHLIEVHGASIDFGSGVTTRPIYTAAAYEQRAVAEFLVVHGADPDAVYRSTKRGRGQASSARMVQPNWPWDRWKAEWQADLEMRNEVRATAIAEVRAREAAAAEAERLARLQARWERDARLPTDVRKDKYMLAMRKNLDEGDIDSALVYCDFLQRLEVRLEPAFDLYHGQILLQSGQSDAALDKLYAFVQTIDVTDPNYMRALELINDAEGR